MAIREIPLIKRQLRLSLSLSALLHVLTIGGVAVGEIALLWLGLVKLPAVSAPRIVLESRSLTDEEYRRNVEHLMADFRDSALPDAEGPASQVVDIVSSPISVEPARDPDAERNPQTVLGERVAARVVAAAAEAENLNQEDALDRLKGLSGQLDKLSTNQSVDEMASKLRGWLGTEKRAEGPAKKAAAGLFDSHTAQLHEVKRLAGADGDFKYVAILVDAQGRTMEEPFDDAAVGESAFRTFELLKSNPLAEMIYRKITMSLLDNVMKTRPAAPPDDPGALSTPPSNPTATTEKP